MTRMELPQRTARGITLIVAASFLTALQDVVFKWLSDQLTLGQIFTLRALITLPLFIALAAWQSSIKAVLSELSHKWLQKMQANAKPQKKNSQSGNKI